MRASIQSVLAEGFSRPARDVLWGHVHLTPALAALTDSAPFARLHRVMQLGPVYRLYPGATHTRASHSIGVYHLGRRLLQNLTERGASEWVGAEGAMSFLCACLLHDLGHFPYAHSLKELSLRSHESLTAGVVLEEPVKSLVARCGADPEMTAAIIDRERPTAGCPELRFYRELLSGCLDPDKLDYLNRDARYCGVPYGMQDVDFVLSRLAPNRERGADIDSRLIPNVEAILFSKYLMYRTVYWHRQVRACTATVKKALLGALESGKIAGEELYGLDDHGLFALLREKNAGAEAVWNGRPRSVAAEIPFDEAEHSALRDIRRRSLFEGRLEREMRANGADPGPEGLVVDLPEPVSFETGLFVLDEGRDFAASASAFKTETVNSFVKTLYTIRIFADADFCQKVRTIPRLCDILYEVRGWLSA